MSDQKQRPLGCHKIYTFCHHPEKDECENHKGSHERFMCGCSMKDLPFELPGLIAGVRLGGCGVYFFSTAWFCSVECYQGIQEEKKLKTEKLKLESL